MTERKGKKAENQKTENEAPEGTVVQDDSYDPMTDPQADPALPPREKVTAMVNPERPYVGGQDPADYETGQRDHTGQIPAENTPYQGKASDEAKDAKSKA